MNWKLQTDIIETVHIIDNSVIEHIYILQGVIWHVQKNLLSVLSHCYPSLGIYTDLFTLRASFFSLVLVNLIKIKILHFLIAILA